MLLRHSLIVCLPLLAVTACKIEKSKKENNAPVLAKAPDAEVKSDGIEGGVLAGAGTEVKQPDTDDTTPPPAPEGDAPADDTNPTQPTTPTEGKPGKGTPTEGKPGKGQPTDPTDTPTQNDPGKNPTNCDVRVIDFEKNPEGQDFSRGDKLLQQYASWGIEFMAHRHKGNGNFDFNLNPILFDSAERPDANRAKDYTDVSKKHGNSDGFDSDLTTDNNGNVMIVPEHAEHAFPDDNSNGGVLKLFFKTPVKVISMDLIDMEVDGGNVELWKKNGNDYARNSRQGIPNKGNHSLQVLTLKDGSYADKLMINLPSGGAVDNIKICIKK